MRLLILQPCDHDDFAWKYKLEGLARAYRRKGHEAVVRRVTGPEGLPRLLAGADLVHLQMDGLLNETVKAIAGACRRSGIPIGASFHDFNFRRIGRGGELLAPPGRRTGELGRFLSGCRWVTAISASLAAEISRFVPAAAGRIRDVPVGFDPDEIARVRAVPPARPFILCVGRKLPYKGIDVLLMAWAALCDEFDWLDLVVCGQDAGPEYYPGLARALGIGSRVRFLGLLGHRKTLSLVRSCLFYVQPSRRETFGMTVLEALACGKAVLATRCGIPEEMVEDGVTGLMAPPRDAAALEAAMRRLIARPRLRRSLEKGAQARAGRYRWDRVAEAYLELNGGGEPLAGSPGVPARGAGPGSSVGRPAGRR